MKILAVIPARAGSKGIPNKNIRIIGGHPLIYYSIKNALNSEMITDVIVSTDSSEVRIIAEQMGAKVKWRDAVLCGDAVTLDAVIADAVPADVQWDYVNSRVLCNLHPQHFEYPHWTRLLGIQLIMIWILLSQQSMRLIYHGEKKMERKFLIIQRDLIDSTYHLAIWKQEHLLFQKRLL